MRLGEGKFRLRAGILTLRRQSYKISVSDARSAEDVQRASDRYVQPVLSEFFNQIDVLHTLRAAGVGRGDCNPLAEVLHQLGLNAPAKTFDVGGMYQEFEAVLCKEVEVRRRYLHIRKLLPAV